MKSKNIIASFKYAMSGIREAFKSERNLKIHLFVAILVIVFSKVLNVDTKEICILIITISLVIGAELFNTALEEVVNILSPEKREEARKAKDIAAGVVLFFAITAIIIGIFIIGPKLLIYFNILV